MISKYSNRRQNFKDISSVDLATEAILNGKDVSFVLQKLYKVSSLNSSKKVKEDVDDTVTVPDPNMSENPAIDIIDAAVSALPEDVETKSEVQDVLADVADFVETLPEQPMDSLISAINDYADVISSDSEDVEEAVKSIRAKYSKVVEDMDEESVDTEEVASLIHAVADNIPETAETEDEIQEYLDTISDALAEVPPEDSIDTIVSTAAELETAIDESKNTKKRKYSFKKK